MLQQDPVHIKARYDWLNVLMCYVFDWLVHDSTFIA